MESVSDFSTKLEEGHRINVNIYTAYINISFSFNTFSFSSLAQKSTTLYNINHTHQLIEFNMNDLFNLPIN